MNAVLRIRSLSPVLEALVAERLHVPAGWVETKNGVGFKCSKCRRVLSPVEWAAICSGRADAANGIAAPTLTTQAPGEGEPMVDRKDTAEGLEDDPIARGPWTLDELDMIIRDAEGDHVAAVAATQRRSGLVMAAGRDMLDALEIAVDTIRQWHDHGIEAKDRAGLWDLYQDSPEMQVINGAIAKARGVEPPAPLTGPGYDLDGLGEEMAATEELRPEDRPTGPTAKCDA